jgi:PAS domain S-box-containing protein
MKEVPHEQVTVVLVEAADGTMQDLASTLRTIGHQVARLPSSEIVASLSRQDDVTAYVLDAGIPGEEVLRICTHASDKVRGLECMFLFATVDTDIDRLRQQALQDGLAQGVIPWPAPDILLRSCIGTHLRLMSSTRSLRDSRQSTRGFFENNHAVMLLVDPANGRIVDANPAAESYYGWSREVLRSKHISDVNTLSPEEIGVAMERARALKKKHFQFRHRRADGSVRDVEVYSGPICVHDRELLYSIIFDNTDRIHAENELRRARKDWEDIFQAIGHLLLILDRDFTILAANQASARLMGLAPELLAGKKCYEVMHGTREHASGCPLAKILSGEESGPVEIEMELESLHGTFLVSCTPVFDERGEIQKFIHVATDITGLKKAQSALAASHQDLENALGAAHELARLSQASSKAKSEFLANMSHEIRTPLNGVCGMLQLLQTTELDAEQKLYVDTAFRSSDRLTTLLTDILDLSRIEAGRMALYREAFELRSLRGHLQDVFGLTAERKGIFLDFDFDPALPGEVEGDIFRLRQILFNLVGNAVKFTERGGVRVSVSDLCRVRGGIRRVLFVVEDTGPGIPEEIMGEIFEPFTQAEGVYVRKHQGAGLGLAIVRKLVRLMGGEIGVESVPGFGSAFVFSLPFGPRRQAFGAETLDTQENEVSSGLRLLVAEDDYGNAFFLRRILEKDGHFVDTVVNGREALKMLCENQYDAVLMDIQMPVMDGLEATRTLRSWKGPAASVPVIALTAYAMVGDREKFLAQGMDGYIPKPVSIVDVRKAIRAALDARRNDGEAAHKKGQK